MTDGLTVLYRLSRRVNRFAFKRRAVDAAPLIDSGISRRSMQRKILQLARRSCT